MIEPGVITYRVPSNKAFDLLLKQYGATTDFEISGRINDRSVLLRKHLERGEHLCIYIYTDKYHKPSDMWEWDTLDKVTEDVKLKSMKGFVAQCFLR